MCIEKSDNSLFLFSSHKVEDMFFSQAEEFDDYVVFALNYNCLKWKVQFLYYLWVKMSTANKERKQHFLYHKSKIENCTSEFNVNDSWKWFSTHNFKIQKSSLLPNLKSTTLIHLAWWLLESCLISQLTVQSVSSFLKNV